MITLKRKQVNIESKTFSAYPKYETLYKLHGVLPLHKLIKEINFPNVQSLGSRIVYFDTMANVTKLLMSVAASNLFPENKILSINSLTIKKIKKTRSKKGVVVNKRTFKRHIVKFEKEINLIEHTKDIIVS